MIKVDDGVQQAFFPEGSLMMMMMMMSTRREQEGKN